MNNKAYFEYSQYNSDDAITFTNPEGCLVLNKNNSEKETELMIANHRLIELITTYKTIRHNISFDENSKNIIINQIANILETTKLINYSSFCVYLQVLGYSFSTYISDKNKMNQEEKIELIKKLVNLYIDYRHDLYSYHGYSDQVLQVNSDASSSRRNGKTGIEKMETILIPQGFVHARNPVQFENCPLVYLFPDKGDVFLFNDILKSNQIKFEFRATRDNKNPDIFLKIYNHYYILEHKMTNGGGGSQNAEINEIIQFINYSELISNWHYISCLQGNFFKKLNKTTNEPKTQNQYNNIIKALENNPNNYFVNGKGFEKLIIDLVNIRKTNTNQVLQNNKTYATNG